jgi:hypothetical protein
VPKLSASSDNTIDVFASVRASDEDEGEDVLDDEMAEMQVDGGHSSSRVTRRQRQSALKYMEQLQRIADRKQKGIVVELQDIEQVSSDGLNRGLCRLDLLLLALTVLEPRVSRRWQPAGGIHCQECCPLRRAHFRVHRRATGANHTHSRHLSLGRRPRPHS